AASRMPPPMQKPKRTPNAWLPGAVSTTSKTVTMPELPEVEVVRRGIQQWATDSVITAVEVLDPRSLRRHTNGPADFITRLTGQHRAAGTRRGRYLWIPIDEGYTAIVVHLGMSGQMLISEPEIPDQQHLKVRITFTTSQTVQELRFVDQ